MIAIPKIMDLSRHLKDVTAVNVVSNVMRTWTKFVFQAWFSLRHKHKGNKTKNLGIRRDLEAVFLCLFFCL